jgi:hypothetical protein
MELRTSSAQEANAVLRELESLGYEVSVKTKTDIKNLPKAGSHVLTQADKLLVTGGDGPLREPLVGKVREHQPYLLAAACIRRPPMAWLRRLVAKTRKGEFPVEPLCAHVASFCAPPRWTVGWPSSPSWWRRSRAKGGPEMRLEQTVEQMADLGLVARVDPRVNTLAVRPKERLTPELIEAIKLHKPLIMRRVITHGVFWDEGEHYAFDRAHYGVREENKKGR